MIVLYHLLVHFVFIHLYRIDFGNEICFLLISYEIIFLTKQPITISEHFVNVPKPLKTKYFPFYYFCFESMKFWLSKLFSDMELYAISSIAPIWRWQRVAVRISGILLTHLINNGRDLFVSANIQIWYLKKYN